MVTASRHARAGSRAAAPRRRVAALLTLTAATALVSACSSGGHSTAASASAKSGSTAAQQACQQVAVVLTNGPDPSADPVGYAQAQIIPLLQIHTSDSAVGKAIASLAGAYRGYSDADGKSKQSTATLMAAIKRINSLCPGAGATT